jgi:hypothetical protein
LFARGDWLIIPANFSNKINQSLGRE